MAITLTMDRHLLHRYGASCDFGACAPAPTMASSSLEVAVDLVTVEQLPLFLLLILPGFISRKVYDLRVPSEAPDTARYVVDALFYGTLNGSIWFLPILWLAPLNETQPLVFLGVLLVALVASPVLLALATVLITQLAATASLDTTSDSDGMGSLLRAREALLDAVPAEERHGRWRLLWPWFVCQLVSARA